MEDRARIGEVEELIGTDFAGSIVQVPLAPGDRVAAVIDGLGRVEAVVVG